MSLSYLTADLPGTGGSIKQTLDDFVVDEVPLYEPSGEGDHLYLWLEKRGLTTFEAVRRVAHAFEVRERDVGYAGLKDARAVTRQWISVPGATVAQSQAVTIDQVRVLDARMHKNKLKLGHLRGNRFEIVIRGTNADAAAHAHAIFAVLAARGVPNRFGGQRFGSRGTSHHLGAALLRGDHQGFVEALLGGAEGLDTSPMLQQARTHFKAGRLTDALAVMPHKMRAERKALHALVRFGDVRKASLAVPGSMRRLYVSALQSWMFNEILTQRLGALDKLMTGDLAFLHRNGSVFAVIDANVEQPRCQTFEVSPSGPLLGTKSLLADGRPGEIERTVLRAAGFARADFAVGAGVKLQGARRPLRIPLDDHAIEEVVDGSEPALRLRFRLPRGSFATVVLDEVMKTNDGISIQPLPPRAAVGDEGDFSDTL